MFGLVKMNWAEEISAKLWKAPKIQIRKRKNSKMFSNLTEFTVKTEVASKMDLSYPIWDGHHDWKHLISTSSSSSNAVLMNLVPRDVDGVSDNIKRTQLVIRDSGVRATNQINPGINAAGKHCSKLRRFSNSLICFSVGSAFSLLLSLF